MEMCDDVDQGTRSEQRTSFPTISFSLSRLVFDHLLQLSQKRTLTRKDFSMRSAEIKPFGAIDLWKFLKLPRLRRPLHPELVLRIDGASISPSTAQTEMTFPLGWR